MLFNRSRHLALGFGAALVALSAPAAAKNPVVGGAAMYPTKTILQNALNSREHTTLVTAVKAVD